MSVHDKPPPLHAKLKFEGPFAGQTTLTERQWKRFVDWLIDHWLQIPKSKSKSLEQRKFIAEHCKVIPRSKIERAIIDEGMKSAAWRIKQQKKTK